MSDKEETPKESFFGKIKKTVSGTVSDLSKRFSSIAEETAAKTEDIVEDKTKGIVEYVTGSPKGTPRGSPLANRLVLTSSFIESDEENEEKQEKEEYKNIQELREEEALGEKKKENPFFKTFNPPPESPLKPPPESPLKRLPKSPFKQPIESPRKVTVNRSLFSTPEPPSFITNPPIKKKEKLSFDETTAAKSNIRELESKFNNVFTRYLTLERKEHDISKIIIDCGNLFIFLPKLRNFDKLKDEEKKLQLVKQTYDLLVYVYDDIRLLAPNVEYVYNTKKAQFPTKKLMDSKFMSTFIEIINDNNLPAEVKASLKENEGGLKADWALVHDMLLKGYINEEKGDRDSINTAIKWAYFMLCTLYKTKPNSGSWLYLFHSDWQTIYTHLSTTLNLPAYKEFVEKHGIVVTDLDDPDRSEWDNVLYEKSLEQIK